ncbi:MAG TPA: sigma-E factor negative regulatory protein [Rhodanobacteraceae bacterium]|nr:sigma-E factor negative regulatory protein [Rhodanobacteraceae bacterium]
MNQDIHEQLSALMDGELAPDQTRFLLRRLGSDVVLTSCWTRYHVVRQVLRRQQVGPQDPGFATRVMALVDAQAPLRARTPWLRWASGGAVAAAVAVTALLVTRPISDSPVEQAAVEPPATASPAVNAPAAMAAAAPAGFHAPLVAPWSPSQPVSASSGGDLVQPVSFDPHLQSYLLRHYEATGAAGQSSFLPYVLLVVPPQQSISPAQPGYPTQNH